MIGRGVAETGQKAQYRMPGHRFKKMSGAGHTGGKDILSEQVPQGTLGGGITASGGLIHEDDRRAAHKGDRHA